MNETTEQTQTVIYAENGRVVIQHTKPVGTQYLTTQQARRFALALEEAAVLVEAGRN